MTQTIKALTLASLCFAIFATMACTQASAQEGSSYKIGVVDMNAVMTGYNKRKSKYEELQKQVKSLQDGIDAMSEKIKTAKEDYDKKKNDLTPEQLLELESKINADYSDYQNELKKSQQKIDSMEAIVLREVVKDIQDAIAEIAKAENYHLVLNKDSGPRGAVLYASTTIEMTSKVLEHLNK